jgi:hypothetical protein
MALYMGATTAVVMLGFMLGSIRRVLVRSNRRRFFG